MDYVLKTNELKKRYRKQYALNGLTMQIPKGSIYGLIGENGSGKTTCMRVICGLQDPTEGTYELFGREYLDKKIAASRRRMGAVVEQPAILKDLSARDNLRQQCLLLGLPSDDGIDDLLKLVGLEKTGKKKVRHFSLGMKQRLGIAVSLVGNPDFLVLDEPMNGLDPQGIVAIRELIMKLNQERGITVLISSHILEELSKMATYYGFIRKGCMIQEISAKDLEAVSRAYTCLTVTDIHVLVRYLDKMGYEYEICAEQKAKIFAKVNISKLVTALLAEGCEVIAIDETEESLESFYLNLTGGGVDA